VPATEASHALLKNLTGYAPSTPPSVGVPAFIDWYQAQYKA
jgi:UDP-glucuronate 4-epimerase